MIVEIQHLTKIYESKLRVVAVDGIDLELEQGEIFGLLGPNGAGKTTTISIATTRTLPTSGTVSYTHLYMAPAFAAFETSMES